MSNKKEQEIILEGSKKKVGTGRWSYRSFIIEKTDYEWVARLQHDYTSVLIPSEKVDKVNSLVSPTAKELCHEIDKILGQIPGKKKPKKVPPKKEKPIVSIIDKKELNVEDCKRIAYDFRWRLEQELKKVPSIELKNIIPRRSEELNKKTFLLGWNMIFEFTQRVYDTFVEKNQEDYDFELVLNNVENKFHIIVKAKTKVLENK
jgi:hypothetical protein